MSTLLVRATERLLSTLLPFINPFVHSVFLEYLLGARHCSGCFWGYRNECDPLIQSNWGAVDGSRNIWYRYYYPFIKKIFIKHLMYARYIEEQWKEALEPLVYLSEVKCSVYIFVEIMEINSHIHERFWVLHFWGFYVRDLRPKIRTQGPHLSGPWFPICKMRELTLYVLIIRFVTCEVTSLLDWIPRAGLTQVFFTCLVNIYRTDYSCMYSVPCCH